MSDGEDSFTEDLFLGWRQLNLAALAARQVLDGEDLLRRSSRSDFAMPRNFGEDRRAALASERTSAASAALVPRPTAAKTRARPAQGPRKTPAAAAQGPGFTARRGPSTPPRPRPAAPAELRQASPAADKASAPAARVAFATLAAEIEGGAAGAAGAGAPAAEAARGASVAPKGALLADDRLTMDIATTISVWPSQGMLDMLDKDEHMRVWALREGPALDALEDATSVVEQRIQDIGCAVYKIGIAMDPIQRFKGYSWSYIYEGYEEMLLLVASTATQCRILERLLIERFKGRQGCQNEAPGGEGMRDSTNLCFVYAVFCDGGTGRAWGLSARKAKRPRAREAVSTSIG